MNKGTLIGAGVGIILTVVFKLDAASALLIGVVVGVVSALLWPAKKDGE